MNVSVTKNDKKDVRLDSKNNERIIKMICEVYMDKIEISGFEYIGPELSFIVNKDLWRESDSDGVPIRWISTMPTHYIATMEKGTVFLFSGIYKEEGQDIVHFLAVSPGYDSIIDEVELTIKELESLTESKLLKFTDIKDVKEISITPSGTLIQDPQGWTYNHPVYLPNEIYIVMGINEYKNSGGRLGIGKKIPLSKILSAYSTAMK